MKHPPAKACGFHTPNFALSFYRALPALTKIDIKQKQENCYYILSFIPRAKARGISDKSEINSNNKNIIVV
jgi:hypothetical protein